MYVVMDPTEDADTLVARIAQSVRDALVQHPEGTCVVVFVSSHLTTSDVVDTGRGFASTDGKGLDGNGAGLITDDGAGKIQVEIKTNTGSRIIWIDL